MARRPRPRKRCKRSRARRLVIKKKLEEKQNESQVPTNSATDYTEDSSEVTFNRLLEEQRKTYIKPKTDAGKDEQSELSSNSDEACEDPDDPDYFPDLIFEKSKDEEDSKITGRRIVDINHLLDQMKHIVGHSKICTMGKFTFQREIVNGTFSTFVYYCDNCEKEYMMTSEPKATKNECNDALVWGALSVGIGYSQIEELFGIMNIPVMGQNKYQSHERKIGKAWEDTLVKKMKDNAEEEKKIALEKGNIFQGKPFITVIGDGGWAKRSYGHGMNSSSGVGVIIGAETKKLLYLGVKNKFCYACSNPRKRKLEHLCYRNYAGPSTGMETSVIVEGFRRSEEDYGLIYKYYIGDGDSSVFARIQEGCQYGRYVQKIECANHVTRALNDNLHKLAENTQFPIHSRQLLSKPAHGESITRLERIVKGVRTAVKEAGTTKSVTDVANLRQDIKNSIDHVFGNHLRCGSFCKRKDSQEENVVSSMDVDLLNKLRSLIGNVESKADSLVFNQTTNHAERYMGYVSKFTGGKRVNLSTGGSYQRRCSGAALAHSAGPSWHCSPWKKFASRSPGAIFKSKILKRERRNFRRKLQLEKNPPKRKRREGGGYDEDYGPLAVKADIDDAEMASKSVKFIEELRKDVEGGNNNLERNTVGQQTNPLWREKRINRLTASRFGSVAKRKPHTSCHNLVKSILIQRPIKTDAVAFGRDNEDNVIQMYEEKNSLEVEKCGLFVDEENPFLGASPDGLVGSHGLVEVKCLYSINDDPIEEYLKKNKISCLQLFKNKIRLKRTHDYFYQIQGQLNICKRDWCDLVVYTRRGELFIERIKRDEGFWKKVQPKLTDFYKQCILPEIVDSRLVRQMKIRDPDFVIDAQRKLIEKRQKITAKTTTKQPTTNKRLKLLSTDK